MTANNSKYKEQHKYTGMLLFCFFMLAILLCFPDTTIPLIRESILIWYNNLLPTLFPAMILSNIVLYIFLHKNNHSFHIPLLSTLYGLDTYGSLVLLLGFLCGFPIGSYLCAKLVREKQLSLDKGQRLLGFCNNLSPIYIVSIYCRLFPVLPPYIVLFIFYGCPLLYGLILLRFRLTAKSTRTSRATLSSEPTEAALAARTTISAKTAGTTLSAQDSRSITELIDYGISDALSSIVRLAGYIVFFRLFLLPLRLMKINLTPKLLLGNLIEITSGVLIYEQYANPADTFTILLYTLPFMTFGGLCCIGQTICMLKDSGLSIPIYLRDKIIQGFLTATIIIIISFVMP